MRLWHKYMLWIRVTAMVLVVALFFRGKPPVLAQDRRSEYSVPDVTHDGLVFGLTHTNDSLNSLAVAQDKQGEQMTRAFQRISAIEANQQAEATELRIWGSLLMVLLSSGVIMQVRGNKRTREMASKMSEAITGG